MCPVKENTQLVQNSRVAGVSLLSSCPASSTPPSGSSSWTRTPRSARGSQGTTVAGKSPSTSRTVALTPGDPLDEQVQAAGAVVEDHLVGGHPDQPPQGVLEPLRPR